ncbi:MAG: CheW protein [Parcubacteria group bacterium Licking1014_1]|nr:MAG: CheW protein [Parcubacteria group bacterium Licking1014_1]
MAFWKNKKKKGEEPSVAPLNGTMKGKEKTPLRPKDAKEVIAQVAQQQQSAEKKVVETKQVITFELDKEEYAAPILDLREILRIPEIIAVPGVPPFVKGIFNLRGQIVVVIDLEKRFALKREHPMEPRDVIIVEAGGTVFGVVVDEVTGVLRVPVTSIRPTPSLVATKIQADYLNGVIVLEESQGTQGTEEKEELAPEQIKELLKTKKPAGGPGRARVLLLLDLPKMLSEEEFLGFGNTVRQTVEEVK